MSGDSRHSKRSMNRSNRRAKVSTSSAGHPSMTSSMTLILVRRISCKKAGAERGDLDNAAAAVFLGNAAFQQAAPHHIRHDPAATRGIDAHALGNRAHGNVAFRPAQNVKHVDMGKFQTRSELGKRHAADDAAADHDAHARHRIADPLDVLRQILVPVFLSRHASSSLSMQFPDHI